MDMFSTHATATAKASRFAATDGAHVPTTLVRDDGESVTGRAWIGRDRATLAHLVHTVNGGETALPLYAVATAVASGKLIPVDAIAAAFAETGKLAALKRAVDKLAAESK